MILNGVVASLPKCSAVGKLSKNFFLVGKLSKNVKFEVNNSHFGEM